jgi:hypothetical protein
MHHKTAYMIRIEADISKWLLIFFQFEVTSIGTDHYTMLCNGVRFYLIDLYQDPIQIIIRCFMMELVYLIDPYQYLEKSYEHGHRSLHDAL